MPRQSDINRFNPGNGSDQYSGRPSEAASPPESPGYDMFREQYRRTTISDRPSAPAPVYNSFEAYAGRNSNSEASSHNIALPRLTDVRSSASPVYNSFEAYDVRNRISEDSSRVPENTYGTPISDHSFKEDATQFITSMASSSVSRVSPPAETHHGQGEQPSEVAFGRGSSSHEVLRQWPEATHTSVAPGTETLARHEEESQSDVPPEQGQTRGKGRRVVMTKKDIIAIVGEERYRKYRKWDNNDRKAENITDDDPEECKEAYNEVISLRSSKKPRERVEIYKEQTERRERKKSNEQVIIDRIGKERYDMYKEWSRNGFKAEGITKYDPKECKEAYNDVRSIKREIGSVYKDSSERNRRNVKEKK